MGDQKRPDFVMTADGELVPTGEVDPRAELEAAEAELRAAEPERPVQKPKVELPAFPRPNAPPPPLPPQAASTEELEIEIEIDLSPSSPPTPPPIVKRPPPPIPPPDSRDLVVERPWGAAFSQDVTEPEQVSIAAQRVPSLADDLSLPAQPPPAGALPPASDTPAPSLWDEDLSSPAEVDSLIRDQNYRVVMEKVADIEGDEVIEAEEEVFELPSSQDVPVIRGTALAPPPPRNTAMRPTVTGAGGPPRDEPGPRRGPPRVPLNRVIKEKNRGR